MRFTHPRTARFLSTLSLCLLLFISSYAHSKTLQGTVVKIADGDTITVLKGKTPYKVRLEGVDCPEKGQPFWKAAKQFTLEKTAGQKVTVKVRKDKDKYRRILGSVILPDGSNLSEDLLAQGLAWHYTRYSKDSHLQALEDAAKKAKVGLWSLPSPQAPWQYRSALKQKRKDK